MEIGPIFRTMLKAKAGFILIALQIAVTMTIMVNAIAIMQEQNNAIARDSGMDEANTFALSSASFDPDADMRTLVEEDLDLIRNIPGVRSAVASNSFPLRQGGWSEGVQVEPDASSTSSVGSAIYFSDEHGVDAFGTTIIAGQNFTPNQVSFKDPDSNRWPAYAIVTEALAKELFPDEQGTVVGKTIYLGDDDPVNIVGVIDRLQAPWQSWTGVERSMLIPQRRLGTYQTYIVRTEPGYRDELMPRVEELLASSNKGRIIRSVTTMDQVRKLAYLNESALVKMLTFIVCILVIITGLGIVGLASFNVSRRTRQIGIRRALGATRLAIMRYFMIENFIVSSVGIFFGAILAVLLNMAMVEAFGLQPLSWYIIPIAMLALWFVGLAAVAGPARRASFVSPSIATRSA
jgi:putative ABC transport system permease protein